MRTVIIGTGAMGSLFGAWLSLKSEVTLFNVRQEAVDRIVQNGVTIEQLDGSVKKYSLAAISDTRQFRGKADLVIIFTKTWATESAARSAAKLIDRKGTALTLQNGLGNKEQIDAIIGSEVCIAGITAQAATVMSPGVIRHCGNGETVIGNPAGQEERGNKLQELFTACAIPTRISKNYQGLIWGKLVINVGINALAALLQVPNGVLGETPECQAIMKEAVEEAVLVAFAAGITLPYDDPWKEVLKVCSNTAANRASMLQDRLRRAPTEIEAINGAIVRRGEALGVATPVNRCITQMIKAMEVLYPLNINA